MYRYRYLEVTWPPYPNICCYAFDETIFYGSLYKFWFWFVDVSFFRRVLHISSEAENIRSSTMLCAFRNHSYDDHILRSHYSPAIKHLHTAVVVANNKIKTNSSKTMTDVTSEFSRYQLN